VMGRELTLLLLKKGANVAALDINEITLKETAALAGDVQGRLSLDVLNIADREAVAAFPEEFIQTYGAVDGIINNAGIIQRFVLVNDLEYKDIERVMKVNFWGVIYVTKTFLPYLLQRPEAYIVNTSSMGGYLPVPGQAVYGATKAAVKLFTEGLHSELKGTPVHVATVFPGAIATNISISSGVNMAAQPPTEITRKIPTTYAVAAAAIIITGMEKNQYHVFVGKDAKLMDFLRRITPERAAAIFYDQMKHLLPKNNEWKSIPSMQLPRSQIFEAVACRTYIAPQSDTSLRLKTG
ncbi:MAG TPA: SDR family oxidoreductase, partial [Bellilinea sp.]|nr:SDR family oxidoreductase [Bellilinea sp.]